MSTHTQADFSTLMSIPQIPEDAEINPRLLSEMAEKAKRFLLSSRYCQSIHDGWLGWGFGAGAAFLFEIVPCSTGVDQLLWVFVGDLPPAYLVVDEKTWIDAVSGTSPHDCTPVTIPAAGENESALLARIRLIRQQFLDDLKTDTAGSAAKPSVH